MAREKILLLHPGEMGAAIGAVLRSKGLDVYWVSQGRSAISIKRASDAGLTDAETLDQATAACNIILSVCPPDSAISLAQAVADNGFRGRYVDANAIAPQTSLHVGEIVTQAGARYTDASIIGPPPAGNGKCRLYLAGEDAADMRDLFNSPPLQAITLHGETGAASALKMCFSGWNKARIGLLMNIRALAHVHDVEDALFAEWQQGESGLMRYFDAAQPTATVMASARKAWRWSPEMTEIAATFTDAGLPGGYHQGAADVFERLASFKDTTEIPNFAELASVLLKNSDAGNS
ncbi:MAG: DUF1932 domain-containing protein [Burkholderiaceae bacterium]